MIIAVTASDNILQLHDEVVEGETYPHPRIPAARLFFVILCLSAFSATSRNPEVRGGDNFLGSQAPS